MPQKQRLKRFFVLETRDGPLVTVNPTQASVLPAAYKQASARSLAAARGTDDVLAVASQGPRVRRRLTAAGAKTGSPNANGALAGGETAASSAAPPAADDSLAIQHSRGGPLFVFSGVLPAPDSFGTTTDEAEIHKRERLGTMSRKPCALCQHSFDTSKLIHRVSRKAIVERQAYWGRTELKTRDLQAGVIYDTEAVCLFCFQFFEETIRSSSSLLDPLDPSVAHVSPADVGDDNAIPWNGSALNRGATAPTHISPPELVEERRLAAEGRAARALALCLDHEWEHQHRERKADKFRRDIRSYRTVERQQWEAALQQASKAAAEREAAIATTSAAKAAAARIAATAKSVIQKDHASSKSTSSASSSPNSSRSPSSSGTASSLPSVTPERPTSAPGVSVCNGPDAADPEYISSSSDEDAIDVTEEIRRMISVTPRAVNALHHLQGPESALQVAKRRLREKQQQARQHKRSSLHQDGHGTSNTGAHTHRNRAYDCRVLAAQLKTLENEWCAYLRECEIHGTSPSPWQQLRFSNQRLRIEEDFAQQRLMARSPARSHRALTPSVALPKDTVVFTRQQEQQQQRTQSVEDDIILNRTAATIDASMCHRTSLLQELARQRTHRKRVTDSMAENGAQKRPASASASSSKDWTAYHGSKRFSMYNLL